MSTVADRSAPIKAATSAWDKIDALLGGTEAMRAAGEKYLQKWPQEDPESYAFRQQQTTLFNATAKTIGSLAGKPFKEPLTYSKETPGVVLEWVENIDLAGRKFDVLALEVFTIAVAYGLTHVLSDFPTVKNVRTKADEATVGARPYLIHIRPTQVLGWRSAKVAGVETLTQFRYMECVTVDEGDFGSQEVQQVRVLEPGKWSTFRKSDAPNGQGKWALFEEGTTSRQDIPLTTFYTLRTGFMTAASPMIDLADLNIEHWQSSSDQRAILHTARVPILALIGVNADDKIVIGAKRALNLPTGADAKWVEHSGRAIGAGRQDLMDLEERMRLMGAELLVKGPGRVSATQASLDTAQQQTYLSSLASQYEDCLDEMIESMASWVKLDVTKSHIAVFKDFGIADFDNTAETLILNARNAGIVSDETAFKEMQRRGTISPDATWEEEQVRIANQPPVGGGTTGMFKTPNPSSTSDAGGESGGAPPGGGDG